MYTDPILEEKWRVQRELAQKAKYDIKTLMENAHKNVLEIARRMNITLKYAKRKGGYLITERKTTVSQKSTPIMADIIAKDGEETYGEKDTNKTTHDSTTTE